MSVNITVKISAGNSELRTAVYALIKAQMAGLDVGYVFMPTIEFDVTAPDEDWLVLLRHKFPEASVEITPGIARRTWPSSLGTTALGSPRLSSAVPFLQKGSEREQHIRIILFRNFIFLFMPAGDTAMRKDKTAATHFRTNRLHKSAARRSPVAGIDINVLAPQARRAVVGIPATLHIFSAVLAGKVFLHSFECFGHGSILAHRCLLFTGAPILV